MTLLGSLEENKETIEMCSVKLRLLIGDLKAALSKLKSLTASKIGAAFNVMTEIKNVNLSIDQFRESLENFESSFQLDFENYENENDDLESETKTSGVKKNIIPYLIELLLEAAISRKRDFSGAPRTVNSERSEFRWELIQEEFYVEPKPRRLERSQSDGDIKIDKEQNGTLDFKTAAKKGQDSRSLSKYFASEEKNTEHKFNELLITGHIVPGEADYQLRKVTEMKWDGLEQIVSYLSTPESKITKLGLGVKTSKGSEVFIYKPNMIMPNFHYTIPDGTIRNFHHLHGPDQLLLEVQQPGIDHGNVAPFIQIPPQPSSVFLQVIVCSLQKYLQILKSKALPSYIHNFSRIKNYKGKGSENFDLLFLLEETRIMFIRSSRGEAWYSDINKKYGLFDTGAAKSKKIVDFCFDSEEVLENAKYISVLCLNANQYSILLIEPIDYVTSWNLHVFAEIMLDDANPYYDCTVRFSNIIWSSSLDQFFLFGWRPPKDESSNSKNSDSGTIRETIIETVLGVVSANLEVQTNQNVEVANKDHRNKRVAKSYLLTQEQIEIGVPKFDVKASFKKISDKPFLVINFIVKGGSRLVNISAYKIVSESEKSSNAKSPDSADSLRITVQILDLHEDQQSTPAQVGPGNENKPSSLMQVSSTPEGEDQPEKKIEALVSNQQKIPMRVQSFCEDDEEEKLMSSNGKPHANCLFLVAQKSIIKKLVLLLPPMPTK